MTVRPLRTPSQDTVQLRVIAGRDRMRPFRTLLWALYTLAAVAAFLAFIYLRTAVDEAIFRINEIEDRIAYEQARRHHLQLEKIRLESPSEIVPIAEQMLGLVLPDDVVPVVSDPVAGAPVVEGFSETGVPRTDPVRSEG